MRPSSPSTRSRRRPRSSCLGRPDQFKNDPEEKTRLEALVRGPNPDHVNRAALYLGVLLYESGKFADAQVRFAEFAKANPNTPLGTDALLRVGFCQVQMKQFTEAINTLRPLSEKDARLGDQALLWMGKAQIGLADPAKPPQEYEAALKPAIDTLRRAAEKSQQMTSTDPEAKVRRAEALLEMADAQQLTRQNKEAAAVYAGLLNDKALPEREEELLQRQATALHLAGEYVESDKVCDRFVQAHPKSTLLSEVLFRRAENAYFTAQTAEKNANLPDRTNALNKMYDEVIKRYSAVVDRDPEFKSINLARYGVAMGHYRKGDLEKTVEVLKTIPDGDRNGDLAIVPYLQADCLIRTAPAKADDALAAGRLQDDFLTPAIAAARSVQRCPTAIASGSGCAPETRSLPSTTRRSSRREAGEGPGLRHRSRCLRKADAAVFEARVIPDGGVGARQGHRPGRRSQRRG